MAFSVVVIPEDFSKDQFILKPIIEAMMKQLGVPRPRVAVLQDPRLGGVAEALKWPRVEEILGARKYNTDLFIEVVDRDCNQNRRARLDGLEQQAQACLGAGRRTFLAHEAWEELEVWLLAGLDLPGEWAWAAVRAECNPKEVYFEQLAAQRGLGEALAGGRKLLGEQAARRYVRMTQLCDELKALEDRVRGVLETRA
jgi:hypothetical protein